MLQNLIFHRPQQIVKFSVRVEINLPIIQANFWRKIFQAVSQIRVELRGKFYVTFRPFPSATTKIARENDATSCICFELYFPHIVFIWGLSPHHRRSFPGRALKFVFLFVGHLFSISCFSEFIWWFRPIDFMRSMKRRPKKKTEKTIFDVPSATINITKNR